MKNVEMKVMEMLQAKGISASEAEVQAAMAKAANGKLELSKDALDNVAGGIDPATIAALAPEIIKMLKELGILGGDDKGDDKGGDGGSGGNTQDNSGNSGLQQNNQNGNNSNTGGMSQTKSSN